MNIKNIDLYEYFKFERKEGYKGCLKCFINDNSEVYGQNYLYPAILILPGGAYAYVSAREADPVALRYFVYGFQAFVLDYTAGSVAKYPVQLIEAAMAMIFIRENAQEFGIAKDMVCAAGFSAGGHLCGCLANLFDEPVLKEKFSERAGFIRPDAAILAYPVVTSVKKSHSGSFSNLCGDDQELKKYLSLENRVKKDSSPAFLWHTYGDKSVPVYNSLVYALACEKNGVPFSLHIFEKGGHGLATAQLDTNSQETLADASSSVEQWIRLSVDWLKDRDIKLKHIN